jgi:hypothetical protein
MTPHLSFFDPSDAFDISPEGSPACPTFYAKNLYKASFDDTGPNHSNHHYSKALSVKIDYERLSPYFAFRPHDVV